MADFGIQIISEDIAIGQIVEIISRTDPGEAPFALVIGAGFSHGLVPTVREIVSEHLPLRFRPNVIVPDNQHRFIKDNEIVRQRKKCRIAAISFWGDFLKENESRGLQLPLSEQGLPLDHWLAYQHAFDPNYTGAMGDPVLARKYLGELMRLNQPRLNAAHFLLTSILGAQPNIVSPKGFIKTETPRLFKFQAAFSRLVFTTNFDPFLQIALQFANRLYFMSDTSGLDEKDLSENQTDAIHLVYVHGSIHRHAQANTGSQIKEIKEKNAKVLAPVLRNHAVIVIGYSGWDDVVVEALATCDKFERGLYWLGLRRNPLQKGAFGTRVGEILQKPGAYYVQIKGADHFMNQLNSRFVNGLPLIDNPIGPLRQKIASISIEGLEDLETGVAESPLKGATQVVRNIVGKSTFKLAKDLALQGLVAAEEFFLKQCEGGSIGHLKSQACRANICTERIDICDKALAVPNISTDQQISILELRADAFLMSANIDRAIADWTQIVEMPNAANKAVWQALLGRAMAFWQKENLTAALVDLTRVIEEIPNKPDMTKDLRILQLACLFYRGGVLCDSEKYEDSISDFTKIVESRNYGFAVGSGDFVSGLFSRAFVWEKMGKADKAIEDYTSILHIPYREPCGQNSVALSKRGWLFYTKNDFPSFLRDTEMALQKSSPPNYATFSLGLALLANKRDVDALVAYRRASEQYPKSINELGLTDLRDAMSKWLAPERARPCIGLLESFMSSRNEPIT